MYRNRGKYGCIKFSEYFVKAETVQKYVTQYANQLMRAKDWQQALLVTQFMPVTQRRLRKHMTFQIIQQKALNLVKVKAAREETHPAFTFMREKLQIPQSLLYIARAMAHQHLQLNEFAMKDWFEVGNFNLSHQILMRNIAPLYFYG